MTMNKNLIPIVTALALGLSGVGCNKSGKLNKTSEFTAPAGPMELKLKWPVGERVVQSIDVKQNMEISVPNQPQPTKQDVTLRQEYGLTVLKADANGGHEVELEFLNVKMSSGADGKPVFSYDSTKKPANDDTDPKAALGQQVMAALFQNIIGAKLQFFLDASNHVERIEGIEALTSSLGTSGQNGPATSIKHMFSKDYLTEMLGGNRYVPPKAVQPGDTWPLQMEYEVSELGTFVIDTSTTFVKWETRGKRNCARLEFQGTIKTKPGQNPPSTGLAINIQDGDISGVAWFDPELGKVIETIANQDMNMSMTVPRAGSSKSAAQQLTMHMKQEVNTKLESVK
jgi:hypothetical protein